MYEKNRKMKPKNKETGNRFNFLQIFHFPNLKKKNYLGGFLN